MTHELKVTTPSDREIAMIRVFDAPARLVFEAWTRPELLKRWLGIQNGWKMAVCEVDLRVGGAYRFVWRKDGKDMAMGGVYREITRPHRLVNGETFDDPWYEGEALVTHTFEEKDGRTTLTSTALYDTKAIRDQVLKTPMESGVARSYEVLDGVLQSMAAVPGAV